MGRVICWWLTGKDEWWPGSPALLPEPLLSLRQAVHWGEVGMLQLWASFPQETRLKIHEKCYGKCCVSSVLSSPCSAEL